MKNFRHVNNTFTNHFDLFIPWFWLIFGATRIHINVSWYGSGSDQMIRIRPDPDPKRCLSHLVRNYNLFHKVWLGLEWRKQEGWTIWRSSLVSSYLIPHNFKTFWETISLGSWLRGWMMELPLPFPTSGKIWGFL